MNDRAPTLVSLGSRRLPTPAVAAAAGLLVGSTSAALVWLGMAGCDASRGSPSCGGGLGVGMLATVVLISWIVGRLLLGFAAVADAAMASFLGVGLAMIVVLLFLVGETFSVWMWVVLPLLTAATFAGSVWLVHAAGGTTGERAEER
jgi:hypothetical protein